MGIKIPYAVGWSDVVRQAIILTNGRPISVALKGEIRTLVDECVATKMGQDEFQIRFGAICARYRRRRQIGVVASRIVPAIAGVGALAIGWAVLRSRVSFDGRGSGNAMRADAESDASARRLMWESVTKTADAITALPVSSEAQAARAKGPEFSDKQAAEEYERARRKWVRAHAEMRTAAINLTIVQALKGETGLPSDLQAASGSGGPSDSHPHSRLPS